MSFSVSLKVLVVEQDARMAATRSMVGRMVEKWVVLRCMGAGFYKWFLQMVIAYVLKSAEYDNAKKGSNQCGWFPGVLGAMFMLPCSSCNAHPAMLILPCSSCHTQPLNPSRSAPLFQLLRPVESLEADAK